MQDITLHQKETKSVLEHIGDLRKRVIISVISVIIGGSIAQYYNKEIIDFLLKPAGDQKLIYLSPLDPLFFILKIDLLAGIIFAFPIISWCIFSYIGPALAHKVRKIMYVLYISSLFLLIVGLVYAYFITVPVSLKFLFSIVISGIESSITVQNYLSFFLGQAIIITLIFQLPIVITAGIYIEVFSPKWLAKRRRYIYLIGTIALAILTPTTDIFNLGIMLIPAIAIFEISLLLGRILLKFKKKRKTDIGV